MNFGTVPRFVKLAILLTAVCPVLSSAAATTKTDSDPILKLLRSVPMVGIDGDFDHLAVDLSGNRLFLSAEEHNSVEVFDLKTNSKIRSISEIDSPHGLLYLPDSNELFVIAGGDGGSCKVINAKTYAVEKTIKLSPDADAIAYDEADHLLYVSNGGKEAGNDYSLISLIDTSSKEHIGDIKIPSTNLEAMALEKNGSRLFVNIRDKNQIGVVDLKSRSLTSTWQLKQVNFNTPLAIDESNHQLFVAGRKPGKFGVIDTASGQEVEVLPANDLVDDMSFDPATNRVYLACGEGFIDIYQRADGGKYEEIAKVPSGYKGKIGFLVPQLHRYFVVTTKHNATPAKLLIYSVER